jgi:hypothetical protein
VSQYGIDPYGGELGPWGGPGLISVLGVLLAAENRFIVVFDRAPLAGDPKLRRDATNILNYSIAPIDPTLTINGISTVPDKAAVPTRPIALARARVDPQDPKQVWVWTDRNMEPDIEHTITVIGPIHGLGCETFVGPFVSTIWGPTPPQVQIAPDRLDGALRDLDDGGTASSGELPEVWRYSEDNDIALQGELESLKKRIIRRCTQMPNSFIWSDNGVPTFLGDLMQVGTLNQLANAVAEQTRKDIMVSAAAVTVEPLVSGGDAYVIVTLSVRLRDRRDVLLTYKLPVK